MSVPNQVPLTVHTGNGVTTVFTYQFLLLAAEDARVSVDGVELVNGVDYSVGGVLNEAGGPITFITPPANGSKVVLRRDVGLARLTDYQYSGPFQSNTVNKDFDRLWMALQDYAQEISTALRLPPDDDSNPLLPAVAGRALQNLGFDASGNLTLVPTTQGDASALGLALASSVLPSQGAGLSAFNQALSYAAGTVGAALKPIAEIPNLTDAAKGSALIGYKPAFTGAAGRSLSSKLAETVSACDFGLSTTNTGAQNNAAIALAIAYAVAQGGLTLHIPRGLYNFATTISLAGAHNLRISGDGIDATILQINHATVDFITAGGEIYQTIDNLTLTSSVTRTAGAMFRTTGFWRRGMIFRVKVSKHFNGVDLFQFEHCTLMETNIVSPTGAGTALRVGNAAATNQGANLNLVTVFIRGNDETVPEGPAVGARGILVYDIEAIYGFNVDISAMLNECMVIDPTFQTANCFFTSCYFDITVGGDNILFQGAGVKNRIQFSNCWISGAGRFFAGAADKFGVRLADAGSYISLAFDACEFVGTSGPGFGTFTPHSEVLFTGCTFNNCGLNTTLNTAVYAFLSALQTKFMQFTGCKFIPSTVGNDFVFTLNCRGNIIVGCGLLRGISYQGGAQFGSVQGNSDPNTTEAVASAATIQISPTKKFYFVTGTTNIGGLYRTYTGHQVSFVPITGFTWLNGGALALKGATNLVAAAGSVLTLQCMSDGTWREISRSV